MLPVDNQELVLWETSQSDEMVGARRGACPERSEGNSGPSRLSQDALRAPVNRDQRKKSGRGARIRTADLLRPRQARYQAALRPDTTKL